MEFSVRDQCLSPLSCLANLCPVLSECKGTAMLSSPLAQNMVNYICTAHVTVCLLQNCAHYRHMYTTYIYTIHTSRNVLHCVCRLGSTLHTDIHKCTSHPKNECVTSTSKSTQNTSPLSQPSAHRTKRTPTLRFRFRIS